MLDNGAVTDRSAVEEAAGQSLIERAQARRDAAGAERVLYLDIPDWDGDLVGKYRVVDRGEIEKMARAAAAAMRDGSRSSARTEADINFILKANVSLCARDPEKDPGESGHDDLVDLGVEIGQCGQKFGQTFRNSHEALLYLFGSNAVAIGSHGQKLAQWMQDPSKPVMNGVTGF